MNTDGSNANLFAQQEANRKASRRLVAGFIIFIAWLGFGGDIIWYLWSKNDAAARAAASFFDHRYQMMSPPNPSQAMKMMNPATSRRLAFLFASCCAKRLALLPSVFTRTS